MTEQRNIYEISWLVVASTERKPTPAHSGEYFQEAVLVFQAKYHRLPTDVLVRAGFLPSGSGQIEVIPCDHVAPGNVWLAALDKNGRNVVMKR